MFGSQLPKLRGNVEHFVYITISISCSSGKYYACFELRHTHSDDVGCDGLVICTSTITHRSLRGTTKDRYPVENRS